MCREQLPLHKKKKEIKTADTGIKSQTVIWVSHEDEGAKKIRNQTLPESKL